MRMPPRPPHLRHPRPTHAAPVLRVLASDEDVTLEGGNACGLESRFYATAALVS